MEQRYRAVQDVLAGSTVRDVAERFGVSRQAVHRWLAWYQDEGLEGLADRSSRPRSSPGQTPPEVEALICELRRNHPRWGARRLLYELSRRDCPGPVPSRITVHRVLIRHGLVDPTPRRRRREDYRRWERGRPMELWQLDIVGGIRLADGGEAKVVTGVDDHSRFCVIAQVVRRATGRAVCLALAEALQRFGVPEEVLTDNGKQFTARFGRGGGEVMFDRICRENGITHRLTKPRSPTTTGKVERFHQTLQRELLDDVEVWSDPDEAQAAIDVFRHEYNTERARFEPGDRLGRGAGHFGDQLVAVVDAKRGVGFLDGEAAARVAHADLDLLASDDEGSSAADAVFDPQRCATRCVRSQRRTCGSAGWPEP